MKICIGLNSDIKEGLYSATGSELRYGQNWAKLLGENGHRVTCLTNGSGSWGKTTPITNVIIDGGPQPNEEFDVFISVDQTSRTDIKAKLKISMNFSLDPPNSHPEIYKNKEWVIVYPLKSQEIIFGLDKNKHNYQIEFLPYPIAQEMSDSHFYNNSILWTSKAGPPNSYHPPFKALMHLAKTHQLKCQILLSHNFYIYNESEEEKARVASMLSSLPLKPTMLGYISFNKLLSLFQRIKSNLHVGAWGLNLGESIVYGNVPLVAQSTQTMLKKVDECLYGNIDINNYDQVLESYKLVLLNENFYNKALNLYQKEFEDNLYDHCLNHFNDIIHKYI